MTHLYNTQKPLSCLSCSLSSAHRPHLLFLALDALSIGQRVNKLESNMTLSQLGAASQPALPSSCTPLSAPSTGASFGHRCRLQGGPLTLATWSAFNSLHLCAHFLPYYTLNTSPLCPLQQITELPPTLGSSFESKDRKRRVDSCAIIHRFPSSPERIYHTS